MIPSNPEHKEGQDPKDRRLASEKEAGTLSLEDENKLLRELLSASMDNSNIFITKMSQTQKSMSQEEIEHVFYTFTKS